MSDLDSIKSKVKKLSAQATQAKMELHDLSEELPARWEEIRDVAARCYDLYAELTAARAQLKALGG